MLREVARLGPYFEIRTGPAEADGPAWHPLPDPDRVRLHGVVIGHARRLDAAEERVAASLFFQGVAARLWSPVVAAAALGVVPDLTRLRWSPGSPLALRLGEPRGWRIDDVAQAAGLIHPMIVDGQLRPLREAMLTFVSLADGLLWGNAASALAGSLNVGPPGPVRGAIVRRLLAREPLAEAGSFGPDGYVRRSCCLYYRVPGGGMCGDCCLLERPGM